jgi:glycosyltransferase involved in cell wall biosynthesis
LFLDQSGQPGGAELALVDIARPYCEHSLVGLFEDGPFRTLLTQQHIPVQVLATEALAVRKQSGFFGGLSSLGQLLPLVTRVVQLSRNFDLVYANTAKALVVGALASALSSRPLVYHLHDILSLEHFSVTNRRLLIGLANRFATAVIANSPATQTAFIQAGGRAEITSYIYNGFAPEHYQNLEAAAFQIRQVQALQDKFVVGHFSRLSPWKGQHVLLEALTHCSEDVTAILVGDALFGEQDYVQQLHQQIARLHLKNRVQFLGFRSDVPELMTACDLVAHTSTAPEPFGRVIVEAMLCGRPVIAAAAGGAAELVEHGQTGWLCPPGQVSKLADIIMTCRNHPEQAQAVAAQGQRAASHRYDMATINAQIAQLFSEALSG